MSHSAPSEIKNFLYSRQKAEEREKDRQLLTAHGAYILSTLLINCLRGGCADCVACFSGLAYLPPNLKGVSSIKNTGGSVVQIDTGLLNEFVCASGYVVLFR